MFSVQWSGIERGRSPWIPAEAVIQHRRAEGRVSCSRGNSVPEQTHGGVSSKFYKTEADRLLLSNRSPKPMLLESIQPEEA